MITERDELIHQVRLSLIVDLGSIVTVHDADDAAHNVVRIAEEHLKPRTITTVEELDKLPLRTLVAAITNNRNVPIIIVFQRGSNWDGGAGWTTPEAVGQIPSEKVFEFIALNGLPTVFTVLHNPEEAAL